MRISRVNDNQIKAVLTRQDLAARNIRLSEFVYGSAKAKELFNELVMKANLELGFNVENDAPLMVEAIPMGKEDNSLMLLISKVEYPEELDMKYSDFTEADENASGFSEYMDEETPSIGASFLEKLKAAMTVQASNLEGDAEPLEEVVDTEGFTRLFAFNKLDDVMRLAAIVEPIHEGASSLYRDEEENVYYLVVQGKGCRAENFNKVCNILSEYSLQLKYMRSGEAFFKEHLKLIRADDALEVLGATTKR